MTLKWHDKDQQMKCDQFYHNFRTFIYSQLGNQSNPVDYEGVYASLVQFLTMEALALDTPMPQVLKKYYDKVISQNSDLIENNFRPFLAEIGKEGLKKGIPMYLISKYVQVYAFKSIQKNANSTGSLNLENSISEMTKEIQEFLATDEKPTKSLLNPKIEELSDSVISRFKDELYHHFENQVSVERLPILVTNAAEALALNALDLGNTYTDEHQRHNKTIIQNHRVIYESGFKPLISEILNVGMEAEIPKQEMVGYVKSYIMNSLIKCLPTYFESDLLNSASPETRKFLRE
ncbi:MAG TPA: hypothetical protein DCR04_02210 [Flavobacteriales bacterium]|nr:hypothetical protein [Flavobacteriales bacterium]